MSNLWKHLPQSPDVTVATGTGNIATTTTLRKAWRLVCITGHFSSATSNAITVTLDANDGAAYDTLLRSIAMAAAADFAWFPDEPISGEKGDEISVAWTNDAAITYGLRIVTEEI